MRLERDVGLMSDCFGMYDPGILSEAEKLNVMEATVAERGQITLPKAVRDALGLTKGTKLTIELEGGRIVMRKDVDDALSRLRGRLPLDGFADTDEAMRAIRGHAPGDPYLPPEEPAA